MSREYLRHVMPMMAGQLLQMLTVTISNIFIGRMLGGEALAAASLLFPIQFFFMAFVIGVSTGASVLVGQAFGAGDEARMRAVTRSAVGIAMVAGIAVGGFGLCCARYLLQLIGTPVALESQALAYADVMFAGIVIQFVFTVYAALLRAVGDRHTPTLAYALSAVLTGLVTPVLIAGLLPRFGIAGSAIVVQVSMALALFWMIARVRREQGVLRAEREWLAIGRLDARLVGTVLRIGIPSGLQLVVMAIAEMVLLGLVNRHGSAATAAYGVVMQVLTYAQLPTMSIAITATILGAHAIGAGRPETLGGIAGRGMALNLMLTGLVVALTALFSGALVGLFVANDEIESLAGTMLRIALLGPVLLGMAGVLAGVMRASGEVMAPTLLTMSAIVAVELPAAWLLGAWLGLRGISMAYPVAFAAMLVLQAVYFRWVWRPQPLRPMG